MMDKYMNTYIDRRMKYLIEEWQLATKNDIADFSRRLAFLADEVTRLTAVENAASVKLSALEARAKGLEAKIR